MYIGREPGGVPKGIQIYLSSLPKLPKLDLTTDTKYVAKLVNVNMWLQTCNSAVYYTGMLYLHNDIFLKPRLHDTTGCQTGCTTGLRTSFIV